MDINNNFLTEITTPDSAVPTFLDSRPYAPPVAVALPSPEAEIQLKEDARVSALAKLAKLGLTPEEITALVS